MDQLSAAPTCVICSNPTTAFKTDHLKDFCLFRHPTVHHSGYLELPQIDENVLNVCFVYAFPANQADGDAHLVEYRLLAANMMGLIDLCIEIFQNEKFLPLPPEYASYVTQDIKFLIGSHSVQIPIGCSCCTPAEKIANRDQVGMIHGEHKAIGWGFVGVTTWVMPYGLDLEINISEDEPLAEMELEKEVFNLLVVLRNETIMLAREHGVFEADFSNDPETLSREAVRSVSTQATECFRKLAMSGGNPDRAPVKFSYSTAFFEMRVYIKFNEVGIEFTMNTRYSPKSCSSDYLYMLTHLPLTPILP